MWKEYAAMAWESLRANKLRSALTLLGMVIGVFAIIVSVTAVQAVEKSVTDTFQSFGSQTFTVSSRGNIGGPPGRRQRRPPITYEEFERLEERAQKPAAISPVLRKFGVTFKAGSNETDPNVTYFGSNQHWADNVNYAIASGRFINDSDVQLGKPVVVLGTSVVEKIFPNSQPLGKTILADGSRLTVIGVFEEKGETFGQDQDMLAVSPITRVRATHGRASDNISIDVRAVSMTSLSETQDEVAGHLRVIRRVQPGEQNNFEIESNDQVVSQVENLGGIIAAGGAGVGLIALLAAGIGIMNIMLVSVTERTREIGTRKAIGARRRDILTQFLFEAVFLCQIGGLLGIILGVVGGNVLGSYVDTPLTFPVAWALGAVLSVTAIALVFGLYPAWKAASLNPTEALRYE
ncbi:MAG: ABC transporter permease [Bacteroidota bacterium]